MEPQYIRPTLPLCPLLRLSPRNAVFPDDTLDPVKDVLASLTTVGDKSQRILKKSPGVPGSSSKKTKDTDVFRVRSRLTSRSIQITLADVKVTPKEELNHETVDKMRDILAETAIVRIMKARREMPMAALFDEVIRQLSPTHFIPNEKMLKKRVESLILREYLQRKDGHVGVFQYLA